MRFDFINHPVLLALVLVLAASVLYAQSAKAKPRATNSLLETGGSSRLDVKAKTPDTIKVVSFNMRWRAGEDLVKLINLLKSDPDVGAGALIALQEVDRNKRRSGHENTAKGIAEGLGMYYAWAAPPGPKDKEAVEEETGVALFSHYPLTDIRRIVLPGEGAGGRYRVAIGATVTIGKRQIRAYSVHAETRLQGTQKKTQLQAVLDDAIADNKTKAPGASSGRPVTIILGDFNTIIERDVAMTDELFRSKGFTTPFASDIPTWHQMLVQLKLDWIWIEKLKVRSFGVDKAVALSDHWPLWVVLELD